MRHLALADPPSGSAGLQPRLPDRLLTALSRYRRGGRRMRAWRRAVALCLLLAAGLVAVAQPPAGAGGAAVQVVTHDLPAAATLAAADLRTTVMPSPPDGSDPATVGAAGRVLAGPIRRGEVLTDVRLLAADGPAPGPGRIAVPVRLDDPGVVALLAPGMRVTVIGIGPDGGVRTLTDDAVVLLVPDADAGGVRDASNGRLIVLAVPRPAADPITVTALSGSVGIRFA